MSPQKIALITGANTGLGLEIVKSLLKSSALYTIIIGSRSLDNASNAISGLKTEFPDSKSTLTALQVDVEDDASIENASTHVAEKFGKIDVLVNNAGAQFDQQIMHGKMTTREAWAKSWSVNTVGTHIFTSTFAPLLLKSDDPRLLFITSGTSTLAGSDNTVMPVNRSPAKGWPKEVTHITIPAYRCSKTGLNMLMREWHRMLLEDGVKTWAISPGYLATGLGGNQEISKKSGALDPSVGANLVRKVIEGERDGDVGKVVSNQGIQAW